MKYKEIIEQLKKQDQTGLEALYNQYGSKLYGYAVKKWHLEDYAWDIVYKTLYKLIEAIPKCKFESQSSFDHFIIKVFNNFLKEHHRNNKYQNEQFVENSNADTPIDNSIDYEEENQEKEDESSIWIEPEVFKDYYESESFEHPKLKKIKQALAELEEVDRAMLLLKSQNFSYEEIAEMLKIEKKLLKVKYFRAKERLIKLFNSLNS